MEKQVMNMEYGQKIIEIESLLKSHGHRFTHSRAVMVKLFVETSEHLKPEEIYNIVKELGISLPTVYRNVDLLKRLGIIKEVVIQNERYYELSIYSKKKLHIHFHCLQCGQIKEYHDRKIFKDMIRQKEMLEEAYQDDIQDITIVMTGICKDCKEKKI